MTMPQDPGERAVAEAMRLREPPPPVMRLSRRALATGGAIGLAGLLGALTLAMGKREETAPKAAPAPAAARPPEALATLPRDYVRGDPRAPALGPPLPGDLGRPMVRAGVAGAPEVGSETRPDVRPVYPGLASALFAAGAGRDRSAAPPVGVAEMSPLARAVAQAGSTGAADETTAHAGRLAPAPSPYTLQAGTLIPIGLVTGVRSDLPGQVIGLVTAPVRDSLTGGHVLIPPGSRVIGAYDHRVAFGQRRLFVSWTRLILPDGRSVTLTRETAVDAAGRAGLQDRVDRRIPDLLGAVAAASVLSAGERSGNDEGGTAAEQIGRAAVSDTARAGRGQLGSALEVRPVLTIRPGTPAHLLLTRDLILEPAGG